MFRIIQGTAKTNCTPTVGINDIEITEDMVKKKLSALRKDKAGGADNLLPRLLMQIQNEISHPYPVPKVITRRCSARRLEKSKCHANLQKGQ